MLWKRGCVLGLQVCGLGLGLGLGCCGLVNITDYGYFEAVTVTLTLSCAIFKN